jgi:hypothetical protein
MHLPLWHPSPLPVHPKNPPGVAAMRHCPPAAPPAMQEPIGSTGSLPVQDEAAPAPRQDREGGSAFPEYRLERFIVPAMDNDMGVVRRKPCDFPGAPAGRARPPGGPCERMACDGPPGGRPLPASLGMQKARCSRDNPWHPREGGRPRPSRPRGETHLSRFCRVRRTRPGRSRALPAGSKSPKACPGLCARGGQVIVWAPGALSGRGGAVDGKKRARRVKRFTSGRGRGSVEGNPFKERKNHADDQTL